jgi:hypothetical protein
MRFRLYADNHLAAHVEHVDRLVKLQAVAERVMVLLAPLDVYEPFFGRFWLDAAAF